MRMTGQDKFLDQVTALLPALRAFGRSLCGDPARADDLVQDTVLKAWTNREQFQSGSNLKAWLFTILRNCYYSELRHRKFEIEDPDGVCAAQMAVAPGSRRQAAFARSESRLAAAAGRSARSAGAGVRHRACRTKKRRMCARSPWAPSRAASRVRAIVWSSCSARMPRRSPAPLPAVDSLSEP